MAAGGRREAGLPRRQGEQGEHLRDAGAGRLGITERGALLSFIGPRRRDRLRRLPHQGRHAALRAHRRGRRVGPHVRPAPDERALRLRRADGAERGPAAKRSYAGENHGESWGKTAVEMAVLRQEALGLAKKGTINLGFSDEESSKAMPKAGVGEKKVFF